MVGANNASKDGMTRRRFANRVHLGRKNSITLSDVRLWKKISATIDVFGENAPGY